MSVMSKKVLVVLFCLFLWFAGHISAQPILGVIYESQTSDTTILNFGETWSFQMRLVNRGNLSFSGNLNLMESTNGASPLILRSLPPVFLAPNDTTAVITVTFPPENALQGGVNVVVIWPAHPVYLTQDSLVKHLFLGDPGVVGIDGNQTNSVLKVFPNPALQKVTLSLRGESGTVTEVRLLDVNGKAVITHKGFRSELNLASLPSGVYFIEVETSSGEKYTTKILH